MNSIHSLVLRTNAALGRLGELQRRAQRLAGPNPIVRSTIKELSTALEELQVANEQLRGYNEELLASRAEADDTAHRFDEFVNAIPWACVWTDERGTIVEANEAAAALLNVGRHRLAGKPFSLFFAERGPFFALLNAAAVPEPDGSAADLVVRPRERRPRAVRVLVRRLEHDRRWCWFLSCADQVLSVERSVAWTEASSGPDSSPA